MASSPQIFVFRVRAYIRERCKLADHGYATACWEWQLSVKSDGYAVGCPPGYRPSARIARAAHEAFVGPIPDGLEIDHLCRIPSCCNPEHLEAVTHAENMARQVAARVTCLHGHPFSEENIKVFADGRRTCRICREAKERARWERRKAAAA
jgi:hypothetical protein